MRGILRTVALFAVAIGRDGEILEIRTSFLKKEVSDKWNWV